MHKCKCMSVSLQSPSTAYFSIIAVCHLNLPSWLQQWPALQAAWAASAGTRLTAEQFRHRPQCGGGASVARLASAASTALSPWTSVQNIWVIYPSQPSPAQPSSHVCLGRTASVEVCVWVGILNGSISLTPVKFLRKCVDILIHLHITEKYLLLNVIKYHLGLCPGAVREGGNIFNCVYTYLVDK